MDTENVDEDMGVSPQQTPQCVQQCARSTPSVVEFYERAFECRTFYHYLTTTSGRPHSVASVVSLHPDDLPANHLCFVVLGHSQRLDYVAHYIVDLSSPAYCTIRASWSQAEETGLVDSTTAADSVPLSRIFFEVFGRPLRLCSALSHALGVTWVDTPKSQRMSPLVVLGCDACGQALAELVETARKRRSAAITVQRAWRRASALTLRMNQMRI